MNKIRRIPDRVYMILTARVHPLSYIMLSYSAFWGAFAMYITFLSPVPGIEGLFFTNKTYAVLWSMALLIVSTMIIVGLHNRIKGLVRWSSHAGLALWLVMFFAWLGDGFLGLPVLAIIHAMSFMYISLASTLNTLDRI